MHTLIGFGLTVATSQRVANRFHVETKPGGLQLMQLIVINRSKVLFMKSIIKATLMLAGVVGAIEPKSSLFNIYLD